jgi:hypothetical protein
MRSCAMTKVERKAMVRTRCLASQAGRPLGRPSFGLLPRRAPNLAFCCLRAAWPSLLNSKTFKRKEKW